MLMKYSVCWKLWTRLQYNAWHIITVSRLLVIYMNWKSKLKPKKIIHHCFIFNTAAVKERKKFSGNLLWSKNFSSNLSSKLQHYIYIYIYLFIYIYMYVLVSLYKHSKTLLNVQCWQSKHGEFIWFNDCHCWEYLACLLVVK
jgi:hypothetical protein